MRSSQKVIGENAPPDIRASGIAMTARALLLLLALLACSADAAKPLRATWRRLAGGYDSSSSLQQWTQHAAEDGRIYYYNAATGESRWAEDTPAAQPSTAQWAAYQTEDGTTYYHNAATGETTWTLPETATAAVAGSGVQDGDVSSSSSALPSGWAMYATPEGVPYYHHAESGETRWEPPLSSSSASGAPSQADGLRSDGQSEAESLAGHTPSTSMDPSAGAGAVGQGGGDGGNGAGGSQQWASEQGASRTYTYAYTCACACAYTCAYAYTCRWAVDEWRYGRYGARRSDGERGLVDWCWRRCRC